jgi:hypothetical protein
MDCPVPGGPESSDDVFVGMMLQRSLDGCASTTERAKVGFIADQGREDHLEPESVRQFVLIRRKSGKFSARSGQGI